MNFSDKLQKLRKENKLSQEQLADMLDVSRQSVSKWESGQTYPEMDKLIEMTKIFKCTLDDLTNDDIKEIGISSKHKYNILNIMDDVFNLLEKSFKIISKMKPKDIGKLIFEIIVLILLFEVVKIPLSNLYYSIDNILFSFDNAVTHMLSNIWRLIAETSYFVLCAIVFIYFFKVRYIDKFDYNKENTTREEIIIKEEINNKETVYVKKRSYVLFEVLGKIFILFIKTIAFCIGISFVLALLMLAGFFIINVILIFSGVLYLGILLSTIFIALFSYILIEIIFNFIFNRNSNIKRIFYMFIISIIGFGISMGITFIDISNTNIIDTIPEGEKITIDKKEYNFNDNIVVDGQYYSEIEYVEDNNLKGKVKVEVSYYNDYSRVSITEKDNLILIDNYGKDNESYRHTYNLIIDDLSKRQIHNYNDLYRISIKLYSSKENIEKIKNNINKYYDEINTREELNNLLQQEIWNLENENESLKNDIEEYKNKIEEYKDRINEMLE